MRFFNALGEFLRDVGKDMIATAQEINQFKSEYENMDTDELVYEYRNLKNRNDKESSNRFKAIRSILIDRGVIQND